MMMLCQRAREHGKIPTPTRSTKVSPALPSDHVTHVRAMATPRARIDGRNPAANSLCVVGGLVVSQCSRSTSRRVYLYLESFREWVKSKRAKHAAFKLNKSGGCVKICVSSVKICG